MLGSLFTVILALQAPTARSDPWYLLRVAVPTESSLRELCDTGLNTLECIPHVGTTDVAAQKAGILDLISKGYRYEIVHTLEDPMNWEGNHRPIRTYAPDDYRFQYFNADQILAYYEGLRSSFPNVVSRRSIGTSINGETIWAYCFKSPFGTRAPNAIVIESLIHAREWITGACTMHIATKLCDLFSTPNTNRAIANQAVWIIPIANPDGYRYTWTTNRLWRKNRRFVSGSNFGIDLNRNYAKGWGSNNGSSGNPASETYRGTAAFSEPETQAVRDFIASLPRVGGFIDYHSYAQLILAPWAYTTTAPPDASLYTTVGNSLKAQMDGFGATYIAGQTATTLYVASGVSSDYVYDVRHNLSFGIELRDTGAYGFQLPADQIYASQDEVWAGFARFLGIVGS